MIRNKTSLVTDYLYPAISSGIAISFGLIILAAIMAAYGIENHIVAIGGLGVAAHNQLILQTRFDKQFGLLIAQLPAVLGLTLSQEFVAVQLIIGVLLGSTIAITIFKCFIAAFEYDPSAKKKRDEPDSLHDTKGGFKWLENSTNSQKVESDEYGHSLIDEGSFLAGLGRRR